MTEYRAVIKRRIAIIAVCAVCALAFVLTAGIWSYRQSIGSEEHIRDFSNGVFTGIFCAMTAVLLVNILKYRAALKDEAKLRALYIKEHDERWLLIQSKTGGWAYQFVMGAVVFAAVGLTFIDEKIGFTLMVVGSFMAFVKLGFLLFYSRKY